MLSYRVLLGFRLGGDRLVRLCLFFAVLFSLSVYPAVAHAQDPPPAGIGLLDSVKTTLEQQPLIHLQQQEVKASRGRFQQESGRFDPTLGATLSHDHEDIPLTEYDRMSYPGLSSERTDTTTAQIDVSKEFRTGITVTPSVGVVRTAITPGLIETSNAGTVNFLISVPLLKGLGAGVADASERAAAQDLATSLLVLRRTLTRQVLATVSSYWDYLSALKILERRREFEARAKRSYEDTKQLIAGDERASADIEQVSANLAAKTAARLQAEQTLFRAKQNLGLAMGLPFEKIVSLPLPADEFPRIDAQTIDQLATPAALKILADGSLDHRADYLAAQSAEKSAKILMKQAENNLLPQLDLSVRLGYSGLKEGADAVSFGESLGNNIPGASAFAGLTYRWPFENNSARGVFLQAHSAHQKTVITAADLARTIQSNVAQDIFDLEKSILELNKYDEAVNQYQKTVDNEREKFLMGMATMSDLLTIEDNLIAAQVNLISVEAVHAKALAQLRSDTGTLLSYREHQISANMAGLTTVPFLGKNRERQE